MKHSLLSLIMILSVFLQTGLLYADEKTDEINSLIQIAEQRLAKLINEGAKSHAAEELDKIAKAIKDAKEALKDNNEEKALLIITIGMAYLKKIDAKKDLLNAEAELNSARSRYKIREDSE